MMKKIVSCVLVGAFVFYAGCYSADTVTKEELPAQVGQADITVYTKDWKYEFSKENYHIQGDTLSGVGVRMFKNTVAEQRFDGSLAFADITLIETRDWRATGSET